VVSALMGAMKDLKWILIGISSLFVAVGLLVMCGMLVWSFHLAKDFTGRYESVAFRQYFWNWFFIGAVLCLMGCIGLSTTLDSRIAIRGGLAAFAVGIGLFILLMPFVDFEGWTGAAAYTLITVEFAGAAVVLLPAGIKRVWQKFRTRPSPR
jgi:hypothetical protein